MKSKSTPMLSKKQRQQIVEFAKRKYEADDKFHGMKHALHAATYAMRLAKAEKGDLEACWIAAILHDIVKEVEDRHIDHGKLGAKEAKAFLLRIGVDRGVVAKVYNAIYFHNRGFVGGPIERQILWDADKLDALLFSTFKSRLCPFCMWKTEGKGYATRVEKDYTFFAGLMRTKTGRAMVKKDEPRIRKMIAKLKQREVRAS